MGKNRDSLSIVADILESASLGASKTRIMFSANLSFKLLEKYLSMVLRAGLLKLNYNKYELTKHGQDFLKNYRWFKGRYDEARKLLEDLDGEREKLALVCAQPQKNRTGN